MVHRRLAPALALAIAVAPVLSLAAEPTFLKLSVQEKGYTEPNVKVNVPLALLDAIADAIKEDTLKLHEIDVALDEVKKEQGIDLPKLWEGIKKLGPTDFIEVVDEKEHVKVWKDTKDFKITVTEKGQKDPKVLVTMPLGIVEGIIGDGTKPITLKGIIAELRKVGPMQFVEIHDEGDHVRIWLE